MNNPYAFFDLFGTLGGSGIDDIRTFTFFDYTIESLKMLVSVKVKIAIITNQSSIGKGEYSMADFLNQKERLIMILNENEITVDNFLFCPHTEKEKCMCKKPKPGLIYENIEQKDFTESYVIGDMGKSDMLLAKNIGAKGILVKTGVGIGSLNEYRSTWKEYEPYSVCEDIKEACTLIASEIKNTELYT